MRGSPRQIEARDDVVDRLYEAVKLYVTAVTRQELDEPESRRAVEILTFTTNLEHVGDIVDRNLMELAAKKMKHRLRFSPAGLEEIRAIHAMVLANLRLALNVFITGDVDLARQLLAQKIGCARPSRPRPSGIWRASPRAGPTRSRPAACIWTSSAT